MDKGIIHNKLAIGVLISFPLIFMGCSNTEKSNATVDSLALTLNDTISQTQVDSTPLAIIRPATPEEILYTKNLIAYYDAWRSKNNELFGETITSYGFGGEHFSSYNYYRRNKNYKSFSSSDKEIYGVGYDNWELYLRNDSVWASFSKGISSESLIYTESIVELKNSVYVQHSRSLNVGFAYDSEAEAYDFPKIDEALLLTPFIREVLDDQPDYSYSIDQLLAKFDPRLPEHSSNEDGGDYMALEDLLGSTGGLQTTEFSLNTEANKVPDEVAVLTKLYRLNVFGKNVTSIPPDLIQLKELRHLSLAGNDFIKLPQGVSELNQIEILDLENNNFKIFPIELTAMTGLTSLNVSGNSLIKIPIEIAQLKNLQTIDLSSNVISSFPIELLDVTGLISLNLSNNKLTKIPPEILKLKNLEYLYLDNCLLTSLPKEISSLKNLKYLSLAGIKLPIEQQKTIRSWFKETNCIVSFIAHNY